MLAKRNILFTFIIILSISVNFCTKKSSSTGPDNNPREVYDKYFYQVPPGDVPQLFAENIVSTSAQEFGITFSADGKECFFTRHEGISKIMTAKKIDDLWPNPATANFSGSYVDLEPMFNPDGSKLFFGSRRPVPDIELEINFHQWYVERDGDSWMDPVPLEQPFLDIFVMYPSITSDGTIYFTGGPIEDGEAVTQYIAYSNFNGLNYEPVEVLNDSINRFYWSAHPFIAPDESYLIYDAPVSSYNLTNDLYISYRDESGNWTKSIKLNEEINTPDNEICPFVTADGKYLFFTRQGDIYWVDASFIEAMRP